jgi:Predicted integral membrane protein
MNTEEQQFSRFASVPSDSGIRVDKSITIERPVADVYSFWRRLDNLPKFMRHVESVEVRDQLHSHWAVKTLAGKVVEWDAEIIEERDNEMISWRSLPESEVANAGSVWFTPIPGGRGTQLRVELKYDPPAGKAGAAIAKLFGRDADAEVAEDLRNLKTFLETGELPNKQAENRWTGKVRRVASKSAKAVDSYVHEQPWIILASAGVACFVLGFLLGGGGKRSSLAGWSKKSGVKRLGRLLQ